jgi:glycosyltransferase involved in cell wall biosynthesis
MNSPADLGTPPAPVRLVIWHTEGAAISGLLSWMWRLKKSLPAAGIELTLASLELQPFRFPQVCDPGQIYDARLRTPQEWLAFLKRHQGSVHLINHAYEYVDLLEKIARPLLERLTLVGICHTDQDFYYHHLQRLDRHLSGIVAVSPLCAEKLEQLLPHRAGTIPVLPDWDLPCDTVPPVRETDPAAPLRVLFNGRLLHLQKRVLDLPEISRHLAQAGANVKLTIAGEGPDLPQLRAGFERGSHVPYRLLPPRAPWEMAELLGGHDVFLQLSEFEGASVSLMEAMAAGLVPVVTQTASGTELLEDGRNALLCPIGDAAAIAQVLIDLSHNRPRLSTIGDQGFRTARDYLRKLDYAASLRQYLESLQDIPPVSLVAIARDSCVPSE